MRSRNMGRQPQWLRVSTLCFGLVLGAPDEHGLRGWVSEWSDAGN